MKRRFQVYKQTEFTLPYLLVWAQPSNNRHSLDQIFLKSAAPNERRTNYFTNVALNRSTGLEMPRSQLDIWDEPASNPFQCNEFTSSDVEEAYLAMVTMQQLDSDHEKNSDIDIL